jgi:hypothetical protein
MFTGRTGNISHNVDIWNYLVLLLIIVYGFFLMTAPAIAKELIDNFLDDSPPSFWIHPTLSANLDVEANTTDQVSV